MKNNLTFEPISISYLNGLYKIWSDEKVIKYTNIEKPCSLDECRMRLEMIIENQSVLDKTSVFIVIKDGVVCGTAGCLVINKELNEFGFFYQINSGFWNIGIGYDSAEWVVNFMKDCYGSFILHADVVENNAASVKIFDRLGFKKTGINKNAFKRDDISYNVLEFILK